MAYFAHSTAVLDEGCTIGDDTTIWHFSHIMASAVIGRNCVLGQNVMVANGVTIGNNIKVQNNVSLYEGVICENDVFIGPSVVFTNVINPRSAVSRKSEFKTTLIKKGASLGANATILCGIEIGEYAFVGAGAVVTKNIMAYSLVTGNPAVQTGWMSEAGYKLVFDENGLAVCEGDKQTYSLKDGVVAKLS
jgi:UDP-2-acetamido-3-amino-2,3-dideoxy-glucuronate N-acetyltransferase